VLDDEKYEEERLKQKEGERLGTVESPIFGLTYLEPKEGALLGKFLLE
jgi:hypothetical protein